MNARTMLTAIEFSKIEFIPFRLYSSSFGVKVCRGVGLSSQSQNANVGSAVIDAPSASTAQIEIGTAASTRPPTHSLSSYRKLYYRLARNTNSNLADFI